MLLKLRFFFLYLKLDRLLKARKDNFLYMFYLLRAGADLMRAERALKG